MTFANHLGDSGILNIHINCIKDGTAASANISLQSDPAARDMLHAIS